MKLVRYADKSGSAVGLVKNEGIIDLRKHWPSVRDDMIALIEMWPNIAPALPSLLADSTPDALLTDVRLLAPVARPGKIMAIGLNYADHVKETGQKMPPHQIWFTKAVTSINGPF